MKRSEVLKLIQQEIASYFSGYTHYSEIYSKDIEDTATNAAESIVNLLESPELNILPPAFDPEGRYDDENN
jgi:hypothetical protein